MKSEDTMSIGVSYLTGMEDMDKDEAIKEGELYLRSTTDD